MKTQQVSLLTANFLLIIGVDQKSEGASVYAGTWLNDVRNITPLFFIIEV
ncbi:MAG: hypothetical protein MUO27_05545 [Sedimentisphaerales bacterium]|nr:hypothetical protein [Sedimentisphaerales bacterium]